MSAATVPCNPSDPTPELGISSWQSSTSHLEVKLPPLPKRPLTPLVNRARPAPPVFPRLSPKLQPLTEHCILDDDEYLLDDDDGSVRYSPSMKEDKDGTTSSPHRPRIKKCPSSHQSAVNERAYVYGANSLEPHYRPLVLCFLIHLCHMIVSRLLLPSLGFVRYRSLRHDMRAVMGFYVLYPAIPKADEKPNKSINVKPLLLLHGFGFGVIPYVTIIGYLVHYYRRVLQGDESIMYRPIIIPEFRWLGLLPNGGITVQWVLRFTLEWFTNVAQKFKETVQPYMPGTGLVTDEDLDKIRVVVGNTKGIRDEIHPYISGSSVNWECRAPHIKQEVSQSGIYLPTMPEVVDEVVSFVRFVTISLQTPDKEVNPTWRVDQGRWIIMRMFGKAIVPTLHQRTDYETRSYRNFWMRSPRSATPVNLSPRGPPPGVPPQEQFEAKAFGSVGFLNPANDLSEINLSRQEFLTRCRLSDLPPQNPTFRTASPRTDAPEEDVVEIMNQLTTRIHQWFEPGSEPPTIRRPSTPINVDNPWDYPTHGDHGSSQRDPLNFDVIAHSYGTAVASCIIKCYTNNIGQVTLLDPICWIVQLTKKAQLCALPPWKVKLFDRNYSPKALSYVSSCSWSQLYAKYGVNAVDLNGKPLEAGSFISRWVSVIAWIWHSTPDWIDWLIDRFLLYVYWYGVYRDFGTRWTTGRQLQGHEYIDDGTIGQLAKTGQLMVVVGLKDLIVSSHSVVQHLNKAPEESRPKVIVNDDHHGICLLRKSVLDRMQSFMDGELQVDELPATQKFPTIK